MILRNEHLAGRRSRGATEPAASIVDPAQCVTAGGPAEIFGSFPEPFVCRGPQRDTKLAVELFAGFVREGSADA
jgi:hypothetical protein